MDLIKKLTKSQIKVMPPVEVGDTGKVHVKVKEGARERIQVFEGTVIAKKHGGIEETITVRRLSYGVGVEKVSPCTPPPSTRSRLSATVLSAGPSCTTCATAWARPPRSARSCKRKRSGKAAFQWGRRLLLFFDLMEDKRGVPARFSEARGYKKLTVEFFAVLWYPLPSETMIAEDGCHV